MFGRIWKWFLICLSMVSSAYCLEWKQGIAPEIYWRDDDLQWSTGIEGINVLSELSWDALHVVGGSIAGVRRLPCDWLVGGSIGGGWIYEGRSEDTDYREGNRGALWCHSVFHTCGYVVDSEIGFGRLLTLKGELDTFVIPALGYAYHRQCLHGCDADQHEEVIADTAKNEWIDSPRDSFLEGDVCFYWANWHSAWFGLSLICTSVGRLSAESGIKLHGLYYHGRGDWVLHDEWDGFDQYTFGFGWELDTILRLQLTQCAYLFGKLKARKFKGYQGRDVKHFSDGRTKSIRFNSVRWRSLQVTLGVNFVF